MNDDSRILVVVDPTEDNDQVCVQRGAWLAEELGVGLELLICYYEQFLVGARAYNSEFHEESRKQATVDQRQKLEGIAGPLREKGLDVIVTSVWEPSLQNGIVRHVLRTQPKLVVKDTHYHSAISRAVFTNTDWGLVRKCPAPLWLNKQHDWTPNPKIIASVDPAHVEESKSNLDSLILGEASMLANALDGQLHAFHSYLPLASHPYTYVESLTVPSDEYDAEMKQRHQALLNDVLEDFSLPSDQVHLQSGDSAQLLPDLAKELDASLVVMGAIARNPLQRFLIGSTTEKVLDTLPCDLLVVKPDWFKSSLTVSEPDYYEGTRETLPEGPAAH